MLQVTQNEAQTRLQTWLSCSSLVGFENDHAVLWHVFSHVVKPHMTLRLGEKRSDERSLYSFHESVLEALRPTLNEGIRSIIVTAPSRTTYAQDFLDHVRRHHAYLIQAKSANRATFAMLVGSADQPHKVAEMAKTKEFQKANGLKIDGVVGAKTWSKLREFLN
jgi:peptidoglycan hydrolase-like protein with peptidoglycan-binding domain